MVIDFLKPLLLHFIHYLAIKIFIDFSTKVDIELPGELPLSEAHAVGESLQEKIEKVPEVERAFVHADFESTHKPEHSVRTSLPEGEH